MITILISITDLIAITNRDISIEKGLGGRPSWREVRLMAQYLGDTEPGRWLILLDMGFTHVQISESENGDYKVAVL